MGVSAPFLHKESTEVDSNILHLFTCDFDVCPKLLRYVHKISEHPMYMYNYLMYMYILRWHTAVHNHILVQVPQVS